MKGRLGTSPSASPPRASLLFTLACRAAACLLPLAAACDNRPTGPNVSGLNGEQILSVSVTPPTDTIRVADTLTAAMRTTLAATVALRGGAVRQDVHFAWSTSDSTVAVVDTVGVVTPRGVGVTRIRASALHMAEATIVVRYAASRVEVDAAPAAVVAGDSLTLAWRALDDAGRHVAGVRFVAGSSDPTRATVDSTGVVRVSPEATSGAVVITVSAAGRAATTTLAVQRRAFVAPTATGAPSALGFAAGGDFTCGRVTADRPFCWGRNDAGQLGSATGDTVCIDDLDDDARAAIACTLTGRRLTTPRTFAQLAAGASHACGLDAGGAAFCWGESTYGQTGTGSAGTVAQPTAVSTALRFASISAGASHTCALTATGVAWCWGDNTSGQLGNGTRLASTTPVAVPGPRRFVQIAAGLDHTCALDAARAAFCWGRNTAGQLGIGSRAAVDTMVAVGGGLTFTRLGAGGLSTTAAPDAFGGVTCGVTSAGAAYCWGAGGRGQLGAGNTASSASPVRVVGSGYSAVAVGGSHVCALRAGEAVCWGTYDLGRHPALAIGVAGTPTAVAPGQSFAAIASGARHSCAVAADGAAACWGVNVFGALGDGQQALVRTTPATVVVPR